MFGTSSYKKKLIIINVANIITTNTESQNRKWEKKKKKSLGKTLPLCPHLLAGRAGAGAGAPVVAASESNHLSRGLQHPDPTDAGKRWLER